MAEQVHVIEVPLSEADEATADAAAEADVMAGRIVSHDKFRSWLECLVKGEKTPPPCA